ncbi:copper chaperone PCu(A)C [Shinella sp. CPCC 100929]|jgi:copper(I)-binding protein|uniref:Copper chaperone PCu(A)C n=1 Tax=Shinella lacus TaxID=2654216 RepID=A0ABT1RE40_9HYPH|nr:copper chaperone PCu(A)C [Shinella lacus]MCQ4633437.1 copper chaperone PCu(A)C [Shinella lacus]
MRILITALLLLLPTSVLAHEFKAGSLLIDHPKIVETPPGAKVAAGYLTVVNSGEGEDRLLAIESTTISRVEMHASTITDGVARMKQLESGLPIPAGKSASLGDEGTHAMFMDLTRQLKAGEKIEAVLAFEKAGRVPVVFNVEKRSAQKVERHEHQ